MVASPPQIFSLGPTDGRFDARLSVALTAQNETEDGGRDVGFGLDYGVGGESCALRFC